MSIIYIFGPHILLFAFIFFILKLLIKDKKENVGNQIHSAAPSPSNTLWVLKILQGVIKIVLIAFIGSGYFFIMATSVMATDSCNATDCTMLKLGLAVGQLLMLASFIYTTLAILWGKKLVSSATLNALLMPYIAVPLFFAIVILSFFLDGM